MKLLYFLTCVVLVIFSNSVTYSQRISIGIYDGVNYSDIHRQDIGGKWSPKPGPVVGFNFGYSFNKSIGVETGIGFSSVYYEHKTYSYPYYPSPLYSSMLPVYLQSSNGTMNFSFVRIPFLFKVSVPSTLSFNMRAGIFYSSSQNYSLNTPYYYPGFPENPKKSDFGYMFSSGISYPLSDKYKASFDVSYLTGRNKFLENYNYRHGSSEFTLGVTYTGFHKDAEINSKDELDFSNNKVSVIVRGGINYSWNKASAEVGKYYGYTGLMAGFSVNFPFGQGAYFQTGFSFDRKGYSIKDSSSSFYRLILDKNQIYYVDTRIQIDYAIIPALLNFPLGNSQHLFFSTGPWLGFKLNSRTVGTAYNEYHSETSYLLRETIVYDDLERLIKGYDLGWIFGIHLSIPVIRNHNIEMALQYSSSFRDVFDTSGFVKNQNPYDPVLSIRNRTISLVLGYKIPLADRKE